MRTWWWGLNSLAKSRFLIVLCCLLFLGKIPNSAVAYVYVNNVTYPSVPARFGRFLVDGKMYDAKLQYFHSNPYMCELDDKTRNNFVPPDGPKVPIHGGGEVTLYGEPVAILVVRGNCPFQRKAIVAETLHESVKFLLVANFNIDNTPEGENAMVEMSSDFGNTRLVLLGISHATGQAMKKFMSEQTDNVTALGGPLIKFDSIRPSDSESQEDIQSMLLSALGLFFMIMSFMGCMIILAGTFAQIVHGPSDGGGGVSGGGDNTNPLSSIVSSQRRLLTEAEVQQLTTATSLDDSDDPTNNNNSATTVPTLPRTSTSSTGGGNNNLSNSIDDDDGDDDNLHLDEADEDQCAICLGDFAESSLTALPCHHKFHTSCISPWLTERQSKCPLCKFDVLQHIRDHPTPPSLSSSNSTSDNHRGDNNATAVSASIWDQIRRYQWLTIQSTEDVNGQQQRRDEDESIDSSSSSTSSSFTEQQQHRLGGDVELALQRRPLS